MATALGMFEMCQEAAARCRRVATRAAQRGHRMWAMAQKYDTAREEWFAAVPRWQWEVA